MASNDTLSFAWELRGNVEEQLRKAYEQATKLKQAVEELTKEGKSIDIGGNIRKNADDATKALLRLYQEKERLDKAISRGITLGVDTSALEKTLQQVNNLINALRQIPAEAAVSKTVVKNSLSDLGYDATIKSVKRNLEDFKTAAATQGPVNLISEQNVSDTLRRIDTIGAAYTRLQKLLSQMGDYGKRPRSAMEMALGGKWNEYPGNYEQQMGVYRDTLARIKKEIDDMAKSGMNIAEPKRQLDALYETLAKLEALKPVDIGAKLGLEHLRGYTGPQQSLSDEAWAAAKREAEVREVAIAAAERHKQKLNELNAAFERQAKAEEKVRQEQAAAAAAQERSAQAAHRRARASAESERGLRKEAEEVVRLRQEMLRAQAVQLQGIIKNGKGTFDTAQLEQFRNALREVVREMTTLKGVMANAGGFTSKELTAFGNLGKGTNNVQALIGYGQRAIDASKAVNTLSESERQFAQTLSNTNASLLNHGAILSDLKMMATQYLSLWGAKAFLDNIIETGGLLEQQRLSIGAILGDMDQANVLFEKIKSLAIQSPFGVVELDRMSKQLTAYGFKYEELYDWTKRLADISAATGTEVSRLALALGHVRSEGALSGYTLRQFAMGNIPLLEKLSEKLNITTKEVRERTKKKEISYEDVKDVLRDLTDEGGMFYRAQETMSQALNAKFKNMRDAFDIMYGEIAESGVGDKLKELAVTLTSMAQHWERTGRDLLFVAGAFGVIKSATLLYNSTLGANAASTLKAAAAKQQDYVNTLRLARQYRILSAEEERLLRSHASWWATSGKLDASQLRLLLTEKKLSEEELLRSVAIGKINKTMAIQAVQTMKVTTAMEKQNKQLLLWKLEGTSVVGKMRLGWIGLGNAIRAAGAAIASFAKMAVPLVAMTWLFDLFSKWKEADDKQKESAEGTGEAIISQYEKILELRQKLNKEAPSSDEDYASAIDEIESMLNGMNAMSVATAKQANEAEELSQKYSILKNALDDTAKAYQNLSKYAPTAIEGAIDATDGYFDNSILTNIDNYEEIMKNYDIAGAKIQKFSSIIQESVDVIANSRFNEELKKQLDGKNIEEQLRILQQTDSWYWLLNNLERTSREAKGAVMDFGDAIKEGQKKWGTLVNDDIPKFAESIEAAFKHEHPNVDMNNLDESMKQELKRLVQEWTKDIEKVRDGIKDKLEEEIYAHMHVNATMTINVPFREAWMSNPILQQVWEKTKNQNVGDDFLNSLANSANSANELWKHMDSQADALKGKWEANKKLFGEQSKEAKKAYSDYQRMLKARDASFGGSQSDGKKSGKSGRGGGKKEDTTLKQWREELKELENFYKIYKRNSEYMSKEDAIQKALDSGVFGGKDLPKNIDDYLSILKNFRKRIEDEINKNPSTERKSFLTDLLTKIDEKDFEGVKKTAESLLKQLDEEISKQAKKWDLYKKILDVTGNRGQASSIAFGDAVRFDNFADQLRDEISNALDKNAKAKGYTIDQLLGMDSESLSNIGILEKGIDGVYKKLQQLKDAEAQLKSEEVDLFLDDLKNAKSLDTELAQIELKYKKTRDAIKAKTSGKEQEQLLANADKNKSAEKAKKTWEYFKKDNEDWGRVFSNLDKMSTQTLERMLNKLREVAPTVQDDVESIKALYEAIDKIEDKLTERNPFATVFNSAQSMSRLRQLYNSSAVSGNRTFTPGAQSAKYYGLKEGKEYTKEEIADLLKAASTDFTKGLEGLAAGFKAIQDVLQPVIDLFDQLGNETLSDFLSMDSNALGAAAQTAQGLGNIGLGSLGPYGAAAAAALSVVSSIAAMHDKSLQKEIEASESRQKEMENLTKNLEKALERSLQGAYGVDVPDSFLKKLRDEVSAGYISKISMWDGAEVQGYISQETKDAVAEAEKTKKYYDAAYASLLAQRDETEHQMQMEQSKKKSDADKIADYKQELIDLQDQIDNFAIDMANALYDIDVKSWAQELGDALFDAWQKGEDGAEAFRKKAGEIIADVVKNIYAQTVIGKAMEDVTKYIAAQMEATNGELDPAAFAEGLAEKLDSSLSKIEDVYFAGLDTVEAKVNEYDMTLKGGGDTSTSTSSGIKSITEQTADLLSSYINAIRADVSVNRETLSQVYYLLQTQSDMPAIAQGQLIQLEQIASNTRWNAESAAAIYELLHGNVIGTNKFSIN